MNKRIRHVLWTWLAACSVLTLAACTPPNGGDDKGSVSKEAVQVSLDGPAVRAQPALPAPSVEPVPTAVVQPRAEKPQAKPAAAAAPVAAKPVAPAEAEAGSCAGGHGDGGGCAGGCGGDCAGGCGCGGGNMAPEAIVPADGANKPVITAVEAIHDFGEVAQGTEVVHIFKVKNTGNAPLVLERADAG